MIRGFDRVINVWGADHHGQVASLAAGVEAMGVDRDRLEIRLGQMISLTSGRMSKRAGNAVDLDDLGLGFLALLLFDEEPRAKARADHQDARATRNQRPSEAVFLGARLHGFVLLIGIFRLVGFHTDGNFTRVRDARLSLLCLENGETSSTIWRIANREGACRSFSVRFRYRFLMLFK
jgi:hypothetical protein